MAVGAGDGEMQTEIVKAALLRGRMCEAVGDLVRNAMNRDVPTGGSLFLRDVDSITWVGDRMAFHKEAA